LPSPCPGFARGGVNRPRADARPTSRIQIGAGQYETAINAFEGVLVVREKFVVFRRGGRSVALRSVAAPQQYSRQLLEEGDPPRWVLFFGERLSLDQRQGRGVREGGHDARLVQADEITMLGSIELAAVAGGTGSQPDLGRPVHREPAAQGSWRRRPAAVRPRRRPDPQRGRERLRANGFRRRRARGRRGGRLAEASRATTS
jgi:hypothetical protein